MLDLAVGGYTREQIKRILHYGEARRISFRYELLGAKNIFKSTLDVAPGGNIALDASAAIKRTGAFVIKDNGMINWQMDRIKPYLLLRMTNGKTCEWPLGVFFMPTASTQKAVGGKWHEVEAYDLSMVLENDTDSSRTYFPAGTLYVDAISTMLSGAGISNAVITNSTAALATAREWELGTPKMEIIQTLLEEINYYDLYVDANGVFMTGPYVDPFERETDYQYKADEFSVLYAGAKSGRDEFNLPNVVIGIVSNPDVGEMKYVYENTDPGNPLSIPARDGRRVVQKIQFDGIASQQDLQAATTRKAQELTEIYEVAEFETALMPHHAFEDMLYLSNATLEGRYMETRWSMTLKAGERMTHSARRMII